VVSGAVAAAVTLGGVPGVALLAHQTWGHSQATAHHTPKSDDGKSKDDTADGTGTKDKSQGPGQHGSAHAREMVAIAMAHQAAMKKWSSCVQQAAGADKANPTAACGAKPTPPGWLKHGKTAKGNAKHPAE
jgi:hypothetical protein